MWTKEQHKFHTAKDLIRGRTINAINSGKIKRKPCCMCLIPKSEAHHKDYLRPFQIIFLCRLHHKGLHRAMNRAAKKYLCKSAYFDREKK